MAKGVSRAVFSRSLSKKIVERLERIRDINLSIDTTEIHPNRLRQLAKVGSRYEPYAFRRFDEVKRYSILVAFLLEITQDLIDQAIEVHDRQMMNLQLKGRKSTGRDTKR
ncbi:hypothetical protein GCM10020331_093260 [Ectobacillus funiculus]